MLNQISGCLTYPDGVAKLFLLSDNCIELNSNLGKLRKF